LFDYVAGETGQENPHSARTSANSTAGLATLFGMVEIVITLTNTNKLPNTVRNPMLSPPTKYPTKTATTGFTYA
jgi:hypothetical protein